MAKKSLVLWGSSKKALDKEPETIYNIEMPKSEEKDKKTEDNTIFTPSHQAYSILIQDRKYCLIVVDIDLTTMVSEAFILEAYDSEPRALMELNRKLAEQSKKMKG